MNEQLTDAAQTCPQRRAQAAALSGTGRAQSAGLQPARLPGFQSGSTHPSTKRAAYVLERKRRRAEQARARRAAAFARVNPIGVQLAGAGIRGPLSPRETATALSAARTPGTSQLDAGAAANVSQPTVSRLLKRARTAAGSSGDGAADGAELLVTPLHGDRRRSNGRPSLLTPAATTNVLAAFKHDPYGGVGAVQKAVLERGYDISPRTLYNWMDKLNVQSRAANSYAELNERLIHGLLNHIEAVQAALERDELSHRNLAYADQTPIYICTGHRSGYSDTIVFGDGGDAKNGKKIGTLWAVVTNERCLRAWFTELNGDEESTKQFFLSKTLPAGWINLHGDDGNIFDLLAAYGAKLQQRPRKMILLIDRLGKSGASDYPVAGHHTPELRVHARKRGVGLLMLPAKGALVNPIELWNMHVKRIMNSLQATEGLTDNWAQLIRGPRNKSQALEMVQLAIVALDEKPATMRWCYHERATGADALARLKDHIIAQAVRAARAAAPVAPFDVWEAAFALRCRMSTVHTYPVSKCRMETYNVYFWLHHLHKLHDGLPPPFVRPLDTDGYEKECRLCKPTTVASRARALHAVCCDNYPGVYHYECLGLDAAPAGAWECLACARGVDLKLRTWVKPQQAPKAPRKARKRRRAQDSDDESAGSDDE